MKVNKREKLERKKYQIEVNHVHKMWKLESIKSDYFEDKFGKYRDVECINEDAYIENEYLEMYGYDMEEGDE